MFILFTAIIVAFPSVIKPRFFLCTLNPSFSSRKGGFRLILVIFSFMRPRVWNVSPSELCLKLSNKAKCFSKYSRTSCLILTSDSNNPKWLHFLYHQVNKNEKKRITCISYTERASLQQQVDHVWMHGIQAYLLDTNHFSVYLLSLGMPMHGAHQTTLSYYLEPEFIK